MRQPVTAIRMFSATYVDAEGGTPDQIDGSDTISYTLEGGVGRLVCPEW